ncbi:hypothetical protein BD414DRAFT_11177 [Trametes punicea]|nr:hypothetical protein BD414DRAFT_11177 [Trametes punicea]
MARLLVFASFCTLLRTGCGRSAQSYYLVSAAPYSLLSRHLAGQSLTRMSSPPQRKLPECWGHRGASAAFPENTLASFERAIRDGAEGIESGVSALTPSRLTGSRC